nr:FIST C-terminal domain-containing protein [Marinobacterium ramblicola]
MIGGSAGDDLRFGETLVYHQGRFHANSAVMVLATTPLPFLTFKTQHFIPGEERLVVTEANPAERVVYEIDGYPATEEYARLVNVPADDLAPDRFAASPVVVLIDGTDYVRSIQKANPDGSLTFYCAIEEGLVLRVARGVDLIENLRHRLLSVSEKLGTPQLVLACDCVLRGLEIRQRGLEQEVGQLLNDYRVVGFNTYGEQFGGVHVNQTLVGIAFGQVQEQ